MASMTDGIRVTHVSRTSDVFALGWGGCGSRSNAEDGGHGSRGSVGVGVSVRMRVNAWASE